MHIRCLSRYFSSVYYRYDHQTCSSCIRDFFCDTTERSGSQLPDLRLYCFEWIACYFCRHGRKRLIQFAPSADSSAKLIPKGVNHHPEPQIILAVTEIEAEVGKVYNLMFSKIPLFFFLCLGLLVMQSHSACTGADSYECSTSLCANYYVLNGTCKSNPAAASCISNLEVYWGGSCVTCPFLGQNNCTAICPDYYYKGSCKPCWQNYGSNCVACTNSKCTECAYSSGTVLANNGKSCVSPSCSISNCQNCYSYNGQQRCQKCKSGYTVDSSYNCVSSTCSISYCTTCKDSSSCAACVTNYKLSNDQTGCVPVCNDTNCVICLKPGYCGTCVSGYNANNGVCTIDCSKSFVANCKTCLTLATCIQCNQGYFLANGGASCIVKCDDSNCNYCTSASTCVTCDQGYFLNSNGKCTRNICPVQYCDTCQTVQKCASCISQYTLSQDQLKCAPTCTTTISNCVRCSDLTTCSLCDNGYKLAGNQCSQICSIGNCSTCATNSTCSLCQAGFQLSQDKTKCILICLVSNCASCSTSAKCDTCNTGYNLVSSRNVDRCVVLCGQGQVNTGSAASPNCQACSTTIPNCMNCHLTDSSNVVCDSCPTGYFIDGAGNCQLCSNQISNCWDCSDPSTCTDCVSGYVLTNDVCQAYACSSSLVNCLNCNSSAPNTCATCLPGFTLDNVTGSCDVICGQSYTFDVEQSICVCGPGTYDADSSCQSCQDSNCYSCTIQGCDTCNDGYFLSGVNCVECPLNCIKCSSTTVCTECDDGYSVGDDGSCISAPDGAYDPDGYFYPCPTGCTQCEISANYELFCTAAADGYSIVASEIIACDSSCRSCSDTTNTSCTACYTSKYLVGGQCKDCTDPYATACLQGNANFSTQCVLGYTPSFSTVGSTTTGGVCKACATNCLQCDSAGPGNCDAGRCATGFVVIVGTSNCTACLGGCPLCSSYNPGDCKKCPDGQYASGGVCNACLQTCATCQDGSTCSSCDIGYSLISSLCLANPANCVSLQAANVCSSCIKGYVLSSDKSACNIDTACNATSKCFVCAAGQYLQKGQCFTCSNLPSNCVTCSPNSKCIKCSDGYYVNSGGCSACAAHCKKCSSSNFCIQAEDGYYIQLNNNRKKNGVHAGCRSPCKTCEKDEKNCLSCITGYTLNGTQCLGNSRVIVRLLLNGDGSAESILSPSASDAQTIYSGASNINRIINALCRMLPSEFNATTPERCYDVLKMSFLGKGSFDVLMNVVDGNFSSQDQAISALVSSFKVGNSMDGGISVLSTTVRAQGYDKTSPSSSTSNPPNLALVLGLSIPLTVLLILIISVVALRNKDETVEMADREDGADSVNAVEKPEANI